MNSNYIAPEALEDKKITCRHCESALTAYDDKIAFYQGRCPRCGNNPSLLQKNQSTDSLYVPRYVPRSTVRGTTIHFNSSWTSAPVIAEVPLDISSLDISGVVAEVQE